MQIAQNSPGALRQENREDKFLPLQGLGETFPEWRFGLEQAELLWAAAVDCIHSEHHHLLDVFEQVSDGNTLIQASSTDFRAAAIIALGCLAVRQVSDRPNMIPSSLACHVLVLAYLRRQGYG